MCIIIIIIIEFHIMLRTPAKLLLLGSYEKWETRSTNEDEREMRGTNEGGMRNGKREAQMRTNGKREAQMRANVETRNGKRECTSGPP